MRPERYKKIYDWFSARPAALAALRASARALPLGAAAGYLALLLLLAARCAAGYEDMRLLAKAVLVPGTIFVGGSALRRALDRPRPYEQPGFCPLLERDARGRAFPSRHALSGGAVAAAWLPVCPAAAWALLALDAGICATRVLGGVHALRDVAAGAALGFLLGAAGMLLL